MRGLSILWGGIDNPLETMVRLSPKNKNLYLSYSSTTLVEHNQPCQF